MIIIDQTAAMMPALMVQTRAGQRLLKARGPTTRGIWLSAKSAAHSLTRSAWFCAMFVTPVITSTVRNPSSKNCLRATGCATSAGRRPERKKGDDERRQKYCLRGPTQGQAGSAAARKRKTREKIRAGRLRTKLTLSKRHGMSARAHVFAEKNEVRVVACLAER